MKQQVIEIAMDDKTGNIIAASTAGTSLATLLDLIPANIGNLGVLMGVILSTTLIICHVRSEIRNTELHKKRMNEKRWKHEQGDDHE